MVEFLTFVLSDHIWRLVLSYSQEECIDHGVGVTLATLTDIPAVEEARVHQHLPDHRVAPIVRSLLGINFYLEVVVAALQDLGRGEVLIHVDTD